MHAILAALPILTVIVMMVAMKKKAGPSLAASWLLSAIIAVAVWNMDIAHVGAYTVLGFLTAIDVILIIFSAIFLLNALIEMKFIDAIGRGLGAISQDRRIQLLIISWFFGSFIEGAAGFGTPAALAAPLLVGLGVPVFFAALASLIGNSTSVVFGAVGTPPIAGFNSVVPALEGMYGAEMTELIRADFFTSLSFSNLIVGAFVPFMMIAAIVARDGRKRGIKDAVAILPLSILAGFCLTIPQFIISHIGAELPTLLGAPIGLFILILVVKKGFLVPKEVYRFQDDPIPVSAKTSEKGGTISSFTAWSPYIVIAGLLILTRLPWLPFVGMIRHENVTIVIRGLFGFEGINWSWAPTNNPGLFPFLPVALAYLIFRGTKGEVINNVFKKTINQVKGASIALVFGVALVQIMRFTDFPNIGVGEIGAMTTEMARALASAFGGAYLIVAPLIGGLGSFVSGSHTVANLMFMSLQVETARMLGLPVVIALVAQASGGAIGNMIAINNVIAVSATTGAQGQESKLIAAAFVPFIIYSILISIVLFIQVAINMSFVA